MSTLTSELDQLQTHAKAGLQAAQFTLALVKREGKPTIEEHAQGAVDEIRAVAGILHRLGAHESDQAAAALANPIPFHALDTPDVRALLAGLEALLPVAERVDASRGRSLEMPIAGCAGCDLAEDLVQLVSRLRLEIFGPSSGVTGGRE